jgi:hypothetical protein
MASSLGASTRTVPRAPDVHTAVATAHGQTSREATIAHHQSHRPATPIPPTRSVSTCSTLVPRPQALPEHPTLSVPDISGCSTYQIPPLNTLVVPLPAGVAVDISHPYATTLALSIQIFQTRPNPGPLKRTALKIARSFGLPERKYMFPDTPPPPPEHPAIPGPAHGVLSIPQGATIVVSLPTGIRFEVEHPYAKAVEIYVELYEPMLDFTGERRMREEKVVGRGYLRASRKGAVEYGRAEIGEWGSQLLD